VVHPLKKKKVVGKIGKSKHPWGSIAKFMYQWNGCREWGKGTERGLSGYVSSVRGIHLKNQVAKEESRN